MLTRTHSGRVFRVAVGMCLAGLLGSLPSGAMAVTHSNPPIGGSALRVGPLTLVANARADETASATSDADARSIALAFLNDPGIHGNPVGYTVQSARYDDGLMSVSDPTGNPVYTTKEAVSAWVYFASAPAQDGYKDVTGWVVVGARDRKVLGGGKAKSNIGAIY